MEVKNNKMTNSKNNNSNDDVKCNSCNSITSITDITLLPLLQLLQNKINIILYYINKDKELTIKDIVDRTEYNIATVSNIIHNETRNSGLLDENIIEIVSENPNKYKITEKGIKILEEIINNYNNNKKQQQEQKSHQEKLKQEIENLKDFIKDNYEKELSIRKLNGKTWFALDFNKVMKHNPILADEILDNPIDTIKKIEIAIETVSDIKLKVRILNLPNHQKLKIGDVRVENLNKFYAIEGIIKQRSQVRPMVTMIRFECPACGFLMSVLQLEKTIKEPKGCGCGRKGKFNVVSKELINLQVLKLEELPEQLDGRTDCQSMTVLLKDNLNKPTLQHFYNPGSRIKVNGIIHEVPIVKNKEKDVVMDMVIEANYVEPQEKKTATTCSKDDLIEIERLSKDKDIITKLSSSFMPDLVGINEQKLAALISIVKGGNAPREEIHVLFAGEPGLAKSEILKRIPKLFKNARYANGASSSSVGLTASVIKDEFTGSWSLQAGAVVMANEGIACIDEVDKMKDEEKNDMNECAEQGTVTINKAGISGSLHAKTTLIMASNPKSHLFDENQPYLKQLNLPFALITRFDLLFILRNTDEEMLKRMEIVNNVDFENIEIPIKEELLIKYIMTARELKPKLSEEAKNEILNKMKLIVQLKISGEGELPLTIRQLHAMRRLSTAFAKLRLSNTVDVDDVHKAWDLYTFSLKTIQHKQEQEEVKL